MAVEVDDFEYKLRETLDIIDHLSNDGSEYQ